MQVNPPTHNGHIKVKPGSFSMDVTLNICTTKFLYILNMFAQVFGFTIDGFIHANCI